MNINSHRVKGVIIAIASVFAAALLLAMAGAAIVYFRGVGLTKPVSYTGATMRIRKYRPPPITVTSIDLDADEANRLAEFFPNLGTKRKSPVAGAWLQDVEIDFKAADGSVTNVISNFEVWSEGRGAWKVRPGLAEYVDSLRRAAPPN